MGVARTPESRKYFIAVVAIFVCAVVAAGALFIAGFALAMRARTPGTTPIGQAHLVFSGRFSGRYAVAATFDVPPSGQRLHSEPSLQFQLFYGWPSQYSLEAGFIRSPRNHDRLSGFFDTSAIGQPTRTVYLAPIADGPHRATLAIDGAQAIFSIDGRIAYRYSDATLLHPAEITIGTYVALRGERAAGTISDVALARDGISPLSPYLPSCVVTTNGLAFTQSNATWVLEGTNRPGAPVVRKGCAAST